MPSPLNATAIHEAQQGDEELQGLLSGSTPSSLKLQRLSIEDHHIYCDVSSGWVRPYLPASLRKQAFDTVHSLSHPSGRATSRLLKEKFIWPGIRKDALRWSRGCIPCQRAKVHRHTRLTPKHIDVPDSRFNHIHLDLIVLPQVAQYRYCLTIIDRFSRWPMAIPLADIQADTIAEALYNQWICLFGTPLTISTDRGTQFESALFASLAKLLGAERIRTTPYHPQSNGMVERWHRTLKAALMCKPHIAWPRILPSVLLGLRTAYKEDLRASPAEMLFGTSLRLPGEFFVTKDQPADPHAFLNALRSHFQALKPVPTAHHASSRPFTHKDLHSCSHVFRRLDSVKRPLEPPYSGPHQVLKRLDDRRFIISINGEERIVSADCLKPAFFSVTDLEQSDHQQPSSSLSPTPPRAKQVHLSLPCRTDKVSEGGVPVATMPSTHAHKRKQTLQPRHDPDESAPPDCANSSLDELPFATVSNK